MKKLCCFLLVGALLVGCCGCGAISDYLHENAPNEVADAFDDAVDQGEQLIEDAASQIKKQLLSQLGDLSDEARKSLEDKIDQMKGDIDINTPIFASYPNQDGNDIAILVNYPNAKLAAFLTEFPVGTYFPDPANETSETFKLTIDGRSVLMSSMQCQAYARYIQEKLYGDHDLRDGYNPDFTNILPEAIGSSTVEKGNLTAETLKTAITAAGPGAHLRTAGKKHSMFIVEVSDDGFVVLQANADGDMLIEETTYTWDGYMDSIFGPRGLTFINVYRPR